MSEFPNGASARHVPGSAWQKSTFSGADGNCVEVAQLPTGEIALRNSRDPAGPALVFTRNEVAAFVGGVKHGEFDLFTSDSADRYVSDPSTSRLRPDSRPGPTAPGYHAVGAEVKDLAESILPGDVTLDRQSAERMLRILGAVELLHRMHRVDSHGRCPICRTKPRLSWHPSSRPDVCSVYAALNLYMGRSLMAHEPSKAS